LHPPLLEQRACDGEDQDATGTFRMSREPRIVFPRPGCATKMPGPLASSA
jgi:hypothetical protein